MYDHFVNRVYIQYVVALKIKDTLFILQNLLERSCFQFYLNKLRQTLFWSIIY